MIIDKEYGIHHILDIEKSQLSMSFIQEIENIEPIYRDTEEEFNEHIYTIEQLLYDIVWSDEDIKVITYIAEVCNENEIGYIRLINE